jgi:hypothetical protein
MLGLLSGILPTGIQLPTVAEEAVAEEAVAEEAKDADPSYRNESIRGQVVWLADALKEHFGISTVPEVTESGLALVTDQGRIYPLVENVRGRAFRKDDRLRGTPTEILARVYRKQPLIQVLSVYHLKDGKRYEVDYWCDVCAIVMYEKGPCSCCQDANRLRKRLVEKE